MVEIVVSGVVLGLALRSRAKGFRQSGECPPAPPLAAWQPPLQVQEATSARSPTGPEQWRSKQRARRGAALLALFALVSAALVPWLTTLTSAYAGALSVLVGRQREEVLGTDPSLFARPFMAALVLCLAIFQANSGGRRLTVAAVKFWLYASVTIAVDVILINGRPGWLPEPLSEAGGLIAGVAAGIVLLLNELSRPKRRNGWPSAGSEGRGAPRREGTAPPAAAFDRQPGAEPPTETEPRIGPPGRGHQVPLYVSADSAPAGYAVRRPAWVAPVFLMTFTALCAAISPLLPSLTSGYADVLSTLSGEPRVEVLGSEPSPSFRPFLMLLILCLGLFAVGSIAHRLGLVVRTWMLYGTITVVIDLVLLHNVPAALPPPLSQMGGVFSGFGGLFVIVFTLFRRYRLPAGVRVHTRLRKSRKRPLLLLVCAAAGGGVVAGLSYLRDTYLGGLHVRFIGGLDSELVLFLLTMICILFVLSAHERRRKPQHSPSLSVAFLIPAYNEAEGIAECIRALDAAVGLHTGPSRLYVVDNGSRDGTREVAQRTLEQCRHLRGEVLVCLTPGKSHALNYGLAHITEDVILRIDADTLVEPSILRVMLPWFSDPAVGGVGGLPLPKAGTPRWLYPLRLIEVYYGVALLRVAQGAADGTMVIPGLMACYRREVVQDLDGFGEGFNGEDADITMRIGRLGYRIITDPDIKVYTEVPTSLAHLREQRQRWSRGLFHMAARNLSCIPMRQGVRGLLILPWSLFNASRRSMMIPVLMCALTVEQLDPSVFSLREVSILAGFLVGLQAVVISVVMVAHRKFWVLPFVPAYLLFRVFKAYVAFETVLTLQLAPSGRRGRRRSEPPVPASPWGAEALRQVAS